MEANGWLAAIVIPIYKAAITEMELTSLKQCLKIFNQHTIIFVGPDRLNTAEYEIVCGNKVNFKIIRFENKYFDSIEGYNKLMLSTGFYKRFRDYKFILIYQLDAFVFRDELMFWCKRSYDYVGAPHPPHKNEKGEIRFLKNYSRLNEFLRKYFKIKHQVSNVGNGGFSLRNTRKCYWLLMLLKKQASKWVYNEDGFFKYWGNLLYPLFKLAPDAAALSFSIEVDPKESFRKLNNKLPFGCHAFERYDWEIWKPYILKDY